MPPVHVGIRSQWTNGAITAVLDVRILVSSELRQFCRQDSHCDVEPYIHTYIHKFFWIAHINSIESLCAWAAWAAHPHCSS